MAKKEKEKKPLAKANGWQQTFNIVGKVKLSEHSFKLNEKSNKSDWIYNSMNLGVEAGEKYGVIYSEVMGGYGAERQNTIYVHGKDENGNDDFKNSYQIDFEDRFTDSILEDIGNTCFMTAGLELDSTGKTYYKKFLTPYDFIAYCAEYLKDGMVVNVKGQLRYSIYNDTLQCRKEINSIALSKAEPKDYKAVFTQTMLLDKDSATKDSIDKDRGVINVDAYLLEKFREYNGWDLTENGKVKGGIFVPLRKTFEFEIDKAKPELAVTVMNKFLKVKKGVTQMTWEGDFVEAGSTIQATEEDLPADIKELVDLGLYTIEEALAKCTVGGTRERRMIIRRPAFKMVDGANEGEKIPQLQKLEEQYDEEDLQLYCLVKKEEEDEEVPFEESEEVSAEADDELEALLAALS